jgi:hypothetical protein
MTALFVHVLTGQLVDVTWQPDCGPLVDGEGGSLRDEVWKVLDGDLFFAIAAVDIRVVGVVIRVVVVVVVHVFVGGRLA